MIFARSNLFYVKLGLVFIKRRCYCNMENSEICDSVKRKCDEIISQDVESETKKIKIESEGSVNAAPSINRIRKPKKTALLLCYLGKKYYGMQRNHGVETVESDLFKALLNAGVILPEELEKPQLMKFQRAARTDKGVSAARQVVSLKIPLNDIAESFPDKVNPFLPPDIRILCVKRVTKAFDAKISCDARTYSYMLPTFAFSDSNPVDEAYRITDDRLKEVNDFLKTFIGTHNFYNFTSGRLPNDASCKRYIISCECGKPFLKDGLEFVVIGIKGQSFMLHQIRKMVGLTIAVLRKHVSANEVLERVWKNDRIDIPMAPGLGLMLEEVHYDWYNKKYGHDGLHEPLQWDNYQESINKFKEEQILANMVASEQKEKSMMQWLQTLPHHTYDVRDQKETNSKIINISFDQTSQNQEDVKNSSPEKCKNSVDVPDSSEISKKEHLQLETKNIDHQVDKCCLESNKQSSIHISE